MKQYSHDYTKASDAESHLHAAQQLNALDDTIEAWKYIEVARRLLQEYLSADNMVEDDDVYGWVKAQDTFDDEELVFIRDIFGEVLDKGAKSCNAEEVLAIINKCQRALYCDEYESIEQYLNNKSGTWSEVREEEE